MATESPYRQQNEILLKQTHSNFHLYEIVFAPTIPEIHYQHLGSHVFAGFGLLTSSPFSTMPKLGVTVEDREIVINAQFVRIINLKRKQLERIIAVHDLLFGTVLGSLDRVFRESFDGKPLLIVPLFRAAVEAGHLTTAEELEASQPTAPLDLEVLGRMIEQTSGKEIIDSCFRHSLVRISDIRAAEGGEVDGPTNTFVRAEDVQSIRDTVRNLYAGRILISRSPPPEGSTESVNLATCKAFIVSDVNFRLSPKSPLDAENAPVGKGPKTFADLANLESGLRVRDPAQPLVQSIPCPPPIPICESLRASRKNLAAEGLQLLVPELFMCVGLTVEMATYGQLIPDMLSHIGRYAKMEQRIYQRELFVKKNPTAYYFKETDTLVVVSTPQHRLEEYPADAEASSQPAQTSKAPVLQTPASTLKTPASTLKTPSSAIRPPTPSSGRQRAMSATTDSRMSSTSNLMNQTQKFAPGALRPQTPTLDTTQSGSRSDTPTGTLQRLPSARSVSSIGSDGPTTSSGGYEETVGTRMRRASQTSALVGGDILEMFVYSVQLPLNYSTEPPAYPHLAGKKFAGWLILTSTNVTLPSQKIMLKGQEISAGFAFERKMTLDPSQVQLAQQCHTLLMQSLVPRDRLPDSTSYIVLMVPKFADVGFSGAGDTVEKSHRMMREKITGAPLIDFSLLSNVVRSQTGAAVLGNATRDSGFSYQDLREMSHLVGRRSEQAQEVAVKARDAIVGCLAVSRVTGKSFIVSDIGYELSPQSPPAGDGRCGAELRAESSAKITDGSQPLLIVRSVLNPGRVGSSAARKSGLTQPWDVDGCAHEHLHDSTHEFAIPELVDVYGVTGEMASLAQAVPSLMAHVIYCMRMQRFETSVGIHFSDKMVLKEAFTHKSFAVEEKPNPVCQDRLSFVGEAVLRWAVSTYLYNKFSALSEGDLAILRTKYTSELASRNFAEYLGLDDMLLVSSKHDMSTDSSRTRSLSRTLFALIAAVYFDQGVDAVRLFIQQHLLKDPLFTTESKTQTDEMPKGIEPKVFLALQWKMGVTLNNQVLAVQSFTIPTAFTASFNYDRLLFVGDSVVRFLLSTMLYHSMPYATDVALNIQLHKMLNTEALAQKGVSLDIPSILRYYQRHVPQSRKTLAEVLLSTLGAVFLDQGLEAVSSVVKRVLPLSAILG